MWLVGLSVVSILLTMLFFFVLKIFGFPLSYDDVLRLVQQLFPVFVGFLLSAVTYVFSSKKDMLIEEARFKLLQVVLLASFSLYWAGVLILSSVFWWSHSQRAPLGEGMPKSAFFIILTVLFSLISGVVGSISTGVFFVAAQTKRTSRSSARNGSPEEK
jgi:hypothetical protein